MKLLGIDYGQKHLGLAISEGFFVEPYKNIKYPIRDIRHLDKKLKIIKAIAEEEKIEKIILGISENKMAKKTREFGELLMKFTGLPVEYYDETLSSQEAVSKMIESGRGKKFRKKENHNIAACIILQNYLEAV